MNKRIRNKKIKQMQLVKSSIINRCTAKGIINTSVSFGDCGDCDCIDCDRAMHEGSVEDCFTCDICIPEHYRQYGCRRKDKPRIY